jgi:hypothetical protein
MRYKGRDERWRALSARSQALSVAAHIRAVLYALRNHQRLPKNMQVEPG